MSFRLSTGSCRRLPIWACVWQFALLMLAGCTTPTVMPMHAPFLPAVGDRVMLSAVARSSAGIRQIVLKRVGFTGPGRCVGYVAGECQYLNSFQESVLKTCDFDYPGTQQSCDHEIVANRRETFTYTAEALGFDGGRSGVETLSFLVGDPRSFDDPIPAYIRSDSRSAIDIVFVPAGYDQLAGAGRKKLAAEVRQLVVDGLLAHPAFQQRSNRFNIFIGTEGASLVSTDSGGERTDRIVPPPNLSKLYAVADVIGYVHQLPFASWRDRASFAASGIGYLTINHQASGTIVHELGHALFGLSDEYCCDGGMIEVDWPHPNLFKDEPACTAANAAGGTCVQLVGSDTAAACGGKDNDGKFTVGGTNEKWRRDAAGDLMGCGANDNAAAGVADGRRINWLLEEIAR